MKMIKKKESKINKTAIVAGAAGIAAAAVGAYWFYGAKHGAMHRKTVASWMLKARADVMDAVEKLEDIDKETYLHIVDDVLQKYVGLNHTTSDITAMAKEMKSAWSHIQAAAKSTKKVAKKAISKVSEIK